MDAHSMNRFAKFTEKEQGLLTTALLRKRSTNLGRFWKELGAF